MTETAADYPTPYDPPKVTAQPIPECHGDLAALATDMAAVQAELTKKRVVLDQTVDTGKYKFKYAALDQLMEVLLPITSALRIAIIQIPVSTTKGSGAKTIVAGEKWQIECTTAFAMGKSGPQDVGSNISYARRYAILAIFGLTPEEDDGGGQRAQERHDKSREREAKQAEEEKGKGSKPPSPVALIESFRKFDVTEQMLVAEAGMSLAKIDMSRTRHLRELFKRLKDGEDASDVFSDAAMRAAMNSEPAKVAEPETPDEQPPTEMFDNTPQVGDLDPI